MMEMGLLVGLCAMIFYTPFMLCKGVYYLAYEELTVKDKLKCAIPIYNMFTAETTYTGGLPFAGISTVLFLLFFAFRVVEAFAGVPTTVANVTIVLLVIAMLAMYVCNFILVFRILKDADVTGTGMTLVFAFIYPIGQYYIGALLPRVLKNSLKEEKTFL